MSTNEVSALLENIWNNRSPEDRSNWIWKAGFTREAAARYRDLQWSSLPAHIRQTLEGQEP